MKSIRRIDIRVGQPLPWPVYDRNGRLLLREGVRIAFEHQIDRLATQGLFVHDKAGSEVTAVPDDVFDWLLATSWGLKPLLNGFLGDAPAEDSVPRVIARAARLCKACDADPEAALASVHLDFRNPYPLAHPVHIAVLCALIAKRLALPEAQRISIACAALTCDLGMFDMPHLEKQALGLDEEQSVSMRYHVARAAMLLERAGVADRLWMDAVRCHHERWNGSGYPDGLMREAIPLGARVLAVADCYAAMIKPRPHRVALAPFNALAELFRGMGLLYDRDVCNALVKEIGMYPPGSFVRLASGETAVVKGHRSNGEWPVYGIYGADDLPYLQPRRRDAAAAGFGITAARAQGECRASESIVRRLWA